MDELDDPARRDIGPRDWPKQRRAFRGLAWWAYALAIDAPHVDRAIEALLIEEET